MFQHYLGSFIIKMTAMFYLCFGITRVRIVTESIVTFPFTYVPVVPGYFCHRLLCLTLAYINQIISRPPIFYFNITPLP